jgi:transposase
MADKRRKSTSPGSEPAAPEAIELPERWSVQRKMELVLRLLRGEPLDAVSRESQVPANELETWKRVFLEHGTRGLKSRSDPEERELTLARAKIGELMMRLELAEHLIEKRGFTDEWKKHKR